MSSGRDVMMDNWNQVAPLEQAPNYADKYGEIRLAINAALQALELDEWGFVSKTNVSLRERAVKQLLQVLDKLETTQMDRACWERGCACCDTRVDTDWVLVEGLRSV